MPTSDERPSAPAGLTRFVENIRRAFVEFLRVPVLVIVGFLALAGATSALDYSEPGFVAPLRDFIRQRFFSDTQATSDLLATLASSIITVTSITFSLLLLAVQQSAAALTHEVYDQFLRRRSNQIYFGYFVGLAVYTLVVLSTVDPPFNPVFGATLSLLLATVALTLMILLLYATVNQMRPAVVIDAIHDHILLARQRQRPWLDQTRRVEHMGAGFGTSVHAPTHGYVVGINVDAIRAAAAKDHETVEIVLRVSIGTFVAFQDVLAVIRTAAVADSKDLAAAVEASFRIEQQRDIDSDPAYGIEELAIIGWTSISTAKSNPLPGLLVLRSLRDLLARWSVEPSNTNATAERREPAPVVYTDDVLPTLFDAFETLAVVASESMQPQTAAEFFRVFVVMFGRLRPVEQNRSEDVIRRSLSALGEHVLTAELNGVLLDLAATLNSSGRGETAALVQDAHQALAKSVGKLASRGTRVSIASQS